MGNIIKYSAAAVIVLVIVGFVILTLTIDSIVKSSIEDVGTTMTGTSVTVDGVSISPFSGQGSVSGFRVANPDDYHHDYALEIDEFSISLDVMSLFSDKVVVKEIVITTPAFFVEQQVPDNNIHTILQHVQDTAPGQASDKALVIERFLLTNGSADLYTEIGGEREARVEVDEIELTDLGRGGAQQAVEEVIREIAEEVAREAIEAAVQSGGEQIRDALRDLFN